MIKKTIVIFLLLLLSLESITTENYIQADITLTTEDGIILFFVKYADREKRIVSNFFAIFEKNQNTQKAEKLVTFDNGVIKNKFGKIILDLSDPEIKLYGLKISVSYPKNKRFTPGLNLDPYFESSNQVGDTQRIQWDTVNQTFQGNPSQIP